MHAVIIREQPTSLSWGNDKEADLLSRSIGDPRPAVGVDIGDGPGLRDDEARREVSGSTVNGLRDRVRRGLANGEPATAETTAPEPATDTTTAPEADS